ncbi:MULTISPECIES: hypothetical protein [Salmonella]
MVLKVLITLLELIRQFIN